MDEARVTSMYEIIATFHSHYSSIFVAQLYNLDREQALETYLFVIPSILSTNHKVECDKPLSLKDLEEALSHMANDKALGLDGFPSEFYKKIWDLVGQDLHKFYLKAMLTRSLRGIINRGNIKFILKFGDLEVITN